MASEYYEKSLKINLNFLGETHEIVANVYNNLGSLLIYIHEPNIKICLELNFY